MNSLSSNYREICKKINEISKHIDPSSQLGKDVIKKAYECNKIILYDKKNDPEKILYSTKKSFYKTLKMLIMSLVTAFSFVFVYEIRDVIVYAFYVIIGNPVDYSIDLDKFLIEFVFYLLIIFVLIIVSMDIEKRYSKLKSIFEMEQLIYVSNMR